MGKATAPRQVFVSSMSCPWGYNYNLGFDYVISFSGSNIPPELYTLQTLINCNGQINGGYTLPKSGAGGSGSSTTTTNPSISNNGAEGVYTTNPSCTTATVQTLRCNTMQLVIQGPGIPYQVINCNPAVGLPVEFTGLSAFETKKGNVVKWSVASEFKNSHYTVKHSTDGIVWRDLEIVKGKGTTDRALEYSILHDSPTIGINYYSLSQTDFDGTTEQLGIAGVENIPADDLFGIFPNPAAGGQTTLRISSMKDDRLDFVLTDQLGRKISDGELSDPAGIGNRFLFESAITIPEGLNIAYLSVYRNGEIIGTEKIISL